MPNLAEQILDLLGKKEIDGASKSILEEMDQVEICNAPGVQILFIREFGLQLLKTTSIEQVSFHIDTTSVRSGDFKPFPFDLPFGLISQDTVNEVEEKLGIPPETRYEFNQTPNLSRPGKHNSQSIDTITWHYSVDQYELHFGFDATTTKIRALMVTLRI